jgi:hypothetical protein
MIEEYQNKLQSLLQRKIKKAFDFYNQTKQLIISIDSDLTEIQAEEAEINKKVKEVKQDVKSGSKKEDNKGVI